MTVVPAQYLRQLKPVDPFVERSVIRGRSFGLSSAGYDIRIGQSLNIIADGKVWLASSLERFKMPNSLLGIVHDKSTWARLGLTVQNTVIEPGWEGHLTLELINHGLSRKDERKDQQWVRTSSGRTPMLEIKEGDPIAQIIFHYLWEPTEQPYSGKYQNQEAGPQPALLEPSC